MSTNRRSNRNRKSAAPSSVKTAAPSAPQAAAPVTQAPVQVPADPNEQVWQHDYDYIFKDLRKLMIVSLALFALIIVIGFFL